MTRTRNVGRTATVVDGSRKLTDAIRREIVIGHAHWDSPSEIARAVNERFGLAVTRQAVEKYNPERAGDKPAKKWCSLFEETRAAALRDADLVPEWHTAVRVRMLGKAARVAERKGNYGLMRELLETIAKEKGDWYSSTRKIVGGNPADGDQPVRYEFVPNVDPPMGVELKDLKPGEALFDALLTGKFSGPQAATARLRIARSVIAMESEISVVESASVADDDA